MLVWIHFHQCRVCLLIVCECCRVVTLSDHAFADYEMLLQLDQPGDQGPQQSTASEAQLASVPSFTYQTDQVCLHPCCNLSSPIFCMMRWQDAAAVHDRAAHGEATDWYHSQSAVIRHAVL